MPEIEPRFMKITNSATLIMILQYLIRGSMMLWRNTTQKMKLYLSLYY